MITCTDAICHVYQPELRTGELLGITTQEIELPKRMPANKYVHIC